MNMISHSIETPIQSQISRLRLFNGEIVNPKNKQEIIHFLKESHLRFEKALIPEIEQNFLGLIKLLPNEPSIPVIFNLFVKFQISFELHMRIEEQTIYPAALTKKSTHPDDSYETHPHEEPFLTEIIECLKRQSYSKNPFCRTLITRLLSFNDELEHHAWIEENLI